MDEYLATLKDNITCSLCYELYNHTSREPKGLPCYHTFCSSCLTKYVIKAREEDKELLCPLCKKEFTISRSCILDDLPTNPTINNLVDTYPGHKEETLLDESDIFACERHGNKQFWFLCTKCNIGLCKFCILKLKDGPHANHPLEDYSTAFEEMRKKIETKENLLIKYAKEIDGVYSVLQREVCEAKQKNIESVLEREKEVIARAKEWKDNVVKEIESEHEGHVLKIATKYDSLKEKLDKVNQDLATLKSLVENKDSNAFATFQALEKNENIFSVMEEIATNFGPSVDFVRKSLAPPSFGNFGKFIPNNEFTWYISTVEKFIESENFYYSSHFDYLNQSWLIAAKMHSKYLEIYLCNSSVLTEKDMLEEVKYELILKSKSKPDLVRKAKHIFTSSENDWGYAKFIGRKQFLDPSNGYVYYNCVTIQAKIFTHKCNDKNSAIDSNNNQ